MEEQEIRKRFSPIRVAIPVVIGLGVAVFILWSSLRAVHYEEAQGGAYVWTDDDGDCVLDRSEDTDFFYVGQGIGDYDRLTYRDTLRKVDWTGEASLFFGLAIVCLFIRLLGYIIRIRILSNGDFSWRQSTDIILLWEFASSLSPSVVGGSAVAIFFLNREGMNLGRSTALVMVTAMMDEFFYVVSVPLALLFMGSGQLFPDGWSREIFGFTLSANGFFWLGYLFTFALLVVLTYAVLINPRGFRYLLIKVFSISFLRRWRHRIIEWGDDLMTTSRALKAEGGLYWAKGIAATFLSWGARFTLLNCLLLMVVAEIEPILSYAKQLVMWMIMLISPTPGSSGVAEFAFYEFFGGSVVPITLVGLLAILWRLLTYFPYIFAGVIILPRWLQRTAK